MRIPVHEKWCLLKTILYAIFKICFGKVLFSENHQEIRLKLNTYLLHNDV